jgi:transposase
VRKDIDRLTAIVRNQFGLDALSGHLFVFISRRKNELKVLFGDAGGFVVYCKTLDVGRFKRSALQPDETTDSITSVDLAMLLEGIGL